MTTRRNRNIQFSTLINTAYLSLLLVLCWHMIKFILWSLGETMRMTGIVIASSYNFDLQIFTISTATADYSLGFIIQMIPQAFLLTRAFFSQNRIGHKWIPTACLVLAIVFNLADAMTNILAFQESGGRLPTSVQWAADGSQAFGYLVCFLVTWFEEVLVWFFAVAGHFIYAIGRDAGYKMPTWLSLAGEGQSQPIGNRQPQPVPVAVSPNGGRQPNRRTRQRPPAPPNGPRSMHS